MVTAIAIIPAHFFQEVMHTWWLYLLEHDEQGAQRPDLQAWDQLIKSEKFCVENNYGISLSGASLFEDLFSSSILHIGSGLELVGQRFSAVRTWCRMGDLQAGLFLGRFNGDFCRESLRLMSHGIFSDSMDDTPQNPSCLQ
jgi:hypothetical protein